MVLSVAAQVRAGLLGCAAMCAGCSRRLRLPGTCSRHLPETGLARAGAGLRPIEGWCSRRSRHFARKSASAGATGLSDAFAIRGSFARPMRARSACLRLRGQRCGTSVLRDRGGYACGAAGPSGSLVWRMVRASAPRRLLTVPRALTRAALRCPQSPSAVPPLLPPVRPESGTLQRTPANAESAVYLGESTETRTPADGGE